MLETTKESTVLAIINMEDVRYYCIVLVMKAQTEKSLQLSDNQSKPMSYIKDTTVLTVINPAYIRYHSVPVVKASI